jgi:Malectin domain
MRATENAAPCDTGIMRIGVGVVLSLACASACTFRPGTISSEDGSNGDASQDDAALDGANTIADADLADAPAGTVVLRMNLAGVEVQGVDFPGLWSADPGGTCNGTAWTPTAGTQVHNTVDDLLFNRNYYGTTACSVGTGLPSGTYRITLLFCENNRGPGCPGSTTRVQSVSIDGQSFMTNVDLVAASGGCCVSPTDTVNPQPYAHTGDVVITDGTVNLALSGDAPAIHAIQVVRL